MIKIIKMPPSWSKILRKPIQTHWLYNENVDLLFDYESIYDLK